MRACFSLACTAVVVASSACLFDDSTDSSVVVCGTSSDCVAPLVCDPGAHLCVEDGVVVDVTAPTVRTVFTEPRSTNAGAIVVVVTPDEPLARATAHITGPDDRDLELVENLDGTWSNLLNGALLQQGVYSISLVTLVDVAGNQSTAFDFAAVGEGVFTIDRRAPEMLTRTPPGGVLGVGSDFSVDFTVDEPSVLAAATVGRTPAATCRSTGAFTFRCDLNATAGFVDDGDNVIDVLLFDGADNVVHVNDMVAHIDVNAPTVVTANAALRFGDAAALTPIAGRTWLIDVDVDEDLIGTPSLTVRSPTGREFTVGGTFANARSLHFSWTIDDNDEAGAYTATLVDAADVFGHATPQPLSLALHVSGDAEGGCANFGARCGDSDGDGFFPCDLFEPDFDDADATAFPGMAEIPDDGVDNDGDGVDNSHRDLDAVYLLSCDGCIDNADTATGAENDPFIAPRGGGPAVCAAYATAIDRFSATGQRATLILAGELSGASCNETRALSFNLVGGYSVVDGAFVRGPLQTTHLFCPQGLDGVLARVNVGGCSYGASMAVDASGVAFTVGRAVRVSATTVDIHSRGVDIDAVSISLAPSAHLQEARVAGAVAARDRSTVVNVHAARLVAAANAAIWFSTFVAIPNAPVFDLRGGGVEFHNVIVRARGAPILTGNSDVVIDGLLVDSDQAVFDDNGAVAVDDDAFAAAGFANAFVGCYDENDAGPSTATCGGCDFCDRGSPLDETAASTVAGVAIDSAGLCRSLAAPDLGFVEIATAP